MFEDPMFDPKVWFLAVADGKIVGAALNWDEGYIKDLVVHPGLARARAREGPRLRDLRRVQAAQSCA